MHDALPDDTVARETHAEEAMGEREPYALAVGLRAAGGSRRGPLHAQNEDAFRLVESADPEARATHGDLYIVCDGVGGRRQGAVASALAIEALARAYFASAPGDPAANLAAAIAAANREVHRSGEAERENAGMATTVVAAVVLERRIIVANVGDSRAYLIADGAIEQLSRDHSLVQDQIESGIITPAEARTSPRRNIITRALGLAGTVEADLRARTEPALHARLLLCTDGVHSVLDDTELAEIVEHMTPADAVRTILDRVEERRGSDDASLIVVAIDGGPDAAAATSASSSPGVITRALRRLTGGRG